MTCTWCARGRMLKHRDPEKARKGYTTCDNCNMTHSPEATIKGSYAYWDSQKSKIITGVRIYETTL